MKPRKVVVMIEMTTTAPVAFLREASWNSGVRNMLWPIKGVEIHQVQVNVVKEEGGGKRG